MSNKPIISAEPRRLSPDMTRRWMPTIDGKIVAGGALPFGGFNTRRQAIEAAEASAKSDRKTTTNFGRGFTG